MALGEGGTMGGQLLSRQSRALSMLSQLVRIWGSPSLFCLHLQTIIAHLEIVFLLGLVILQESQDSIHEVDVVLAGRPRVVHGFKGMDACLSDQVLNVPESWCDC